MTLSLFVQIYIAISLFFFLFMAVIWKTDDLFNSTVKVFMYGMALCATAILAKYYLVL